MSRRFSWCVGRHCSVLPNLPWVGNNGSGEFSEKAQKGLPGVLLGWPGSSSYLFTCPGLFFLPFPRVYQSLGDVWAVAAPRVLPRPASHSLRMRCRALFPFPRNGKNSQSFLLAGPPEKAWKPGVRGSKLRGCAPQVIRQGSLCQYFPCELGSLSKRNLGAHLFIDNSHVSLWGLVVFYSLACRAKRVIWQQLWGALNKTYKDSYSSTLG